MSPRPRTEPRPSPAAGGLWAAIDGAVVVVDAGGTVQGASQGTAELHEGLAFEDWWPAVHARLSPALADLADEAQLTVRLPETLGSQELDVRLLPAEDDGGFLAILKDQRELDALQADLRLASQMRRLQSSLRQAAHDLKAPLQAMTLNADILRRELEAEGLDQGLERVEVIDRELRRLGRMVQVLLSQSPGERSAARRFDLRRLVRELATLVRPQAREQNVAVEVQAPRETAQVLGVRDHLKQALLNLMVNALEAMPDGGRLRLDLSLTGDGSQALLLLQDSGCGIDPAIRGRLFKLHATTKATGTGIGLYTSRATIQRLGGSLDLESDGERGTTARVVLPLATRPGDEHSHADQDRS